MHRSYVINLKRREDRLSNFMDRYKSNDINVEYAFDGKFYENESDEEQRLFSTKFTHLNPGEIGCFLSHIRLFKRLVESEEPYFIIFEDDALHCDNFHDKFAIICNELPEDFNILYFGGRFWPDFVMNPENYRHITENIVEHVFETRTYLHSYRIQHDRTTHGYIISKKIAAFFLNIFNSVENICAPIDEFMIRTMVDADIKIYDSKPLLCYSPWNGESDIRI